MNRRTFITTTALALPLSTLMAESMMVKNTKSSNRRSTDSYFTHDEMKKWCDKNGCHYMTDSELDNPKLVIAYTVSHPNNSNMKVDENYMDSWLKEMRNDRGNPDYRFKIVDVRKFDSVYEKNTLLCNEKEYTSVHYVYGSY